MLFFGHLHDVTGCREDVLPGATVDEVVDRAALRYGDRFTQALDSTCRIWVNGEPAHRDVDVTDVDEVAFLPPISGG